MDILTNKRYEQYDYICRYTGVPYYYNTVDKKEIYGIGSNMKKTTPYGFNDPNAKWASLA